MVLALLLMGCGTEAWERDPAVQAAQQACKGLGQGDAYDCIERRAVESLNPDLCRLAGKWIDDMCVQAVYEAAGDPAICEQLYLQGIGPTCRAYYAALRAPRQTPLPPEPLPAFLLEVFPQPAAVLSLAEYTDPGWRPGRPSEQQVPQSVCVEIEASKLLARSDFWKAADVQERTTVLVDAGREYQELVTAFVDQEVLHTVVVPPDDPGGTAIASVGGPYHLCVDAPLPAGVHRVDVRFEKSSGEVVSYAWTFELLAASHPRHTPSPKAVATAGDQGALGVVWHRILFSYNHNGRTELWTVDPASDATQQQIRPDQVIKDPALSPSGDMIAYIRVTGDDGGGGSELWLMDRDGGNAHPLYVPPAIQSVLSSPAWSSTGQQLYFLQHGAFTDSRLMRLAVAGRELTTVVTDCLDFALSPQGERMISVSLDRQLTISDREGTRRRDLEQQGIAFTDYHSLTASPDGSLLAFRAVEAKGEDTWNLYIVGWEGRGVRRLTNLKEFHPFTRSSGQVNGLAWTADGAHLVYSVDGHPEQRGIWVFDLDVGQARRLFVWEEGEWAAVQGPWFEPGMEE